MGTWSFFAYIMIKFNKHYNLIILVIIILLLRIDVVYALRPQVGRGLPRAETTIKNEVYKNIAGLPVTWTASFEKTGLRVACVQLKKYDFGEDTKRMKEIVLGFKKLEKDVPDLVIFPEVTKEKCTHEQNEERKRKLKKIAIETGIAIGYGSYLPYKSKNNTVYYIISSEGKIIELIKEFYSDEDSDHENRIFSIGKYSICILICSETSSVVQGISGVSMIVNEAKRLKNDIKKHKPDLLIVPADIRTSKFYKDFGDRLYSEFKIPTALVNRTFDDIGQSGSSFVYSEKSEEKISLSPDKEEILMVDISETTNPILSGEMAFNTSKGEAEIVQLTPQNIEQYKEDILRIQKNLPYGAPNYISSILSMPEKMGMYFSYVAIVDGKVAGHIICTQKELSPLLYINTIAIDEEYSKRGIGDTFLWLVSKKAQDEDISMITIGVRSNNENLKQFLFRRGFSKGLFLSAEVSDVLERITEIMRESSITELENITPAIGL